MTILLMHVSQIMEEMAEDKWLELAVSSNPGREELMVTHGGIGSDGYRMHLTKNSVYVPGDAHSGNCFDVLERPEIAGAQLLFSMQKKFLIEALAGIGDDDDGYIVFYGTAPDKAVVIADQNSNRVAVCMPISLFTAPLTLPARSPQIPDPKDGFGTDEEKAKYKADVDFNKSLRGGTPSQRIG